MMSIPQQASTGLSKAAGPVFASFRLGDEEFAVDVRHVQEVVRRPSALLSLPLQPAFAQGVFNLRGTIIPLLNTGRLLGLPCDADGAEAKVAIVHHRGVRLGLSCDDTSRVLRPRGDELTPFAFADRSEHPVAAGVLKLEDGLLTVLDLDRLIELADIPHATHAEAVAQARAKQMRRRCITFRVGTSMLAFPIGDIHEIVVPQHLERSPIPDPLTAGVLHIRERLVPVVRFASLLGQGNGPTQGGPLGADERVIVLEAEGLHIGLLVDAVDAIEIYTQEQCMAVPPLSRHRIGMYSACIDLGERGHVFMLDSRNILLRDEVARITGQHSELFTRQTSVGKARTSGRGAGTTAYLWFRAGKDFAMRMRDIREIVDLRGDLIDMPGAPPFVCGMLNLRGRMVTVIDVRAFLSTDAAVGDLQTGGKVLVVERDEGLVGLRVDDVHGILHVHAEDCLPVPGLMRMTLPVMLRDDVREIVPAVDEKGRSISLLSLNVDRLMQALQAEPAEADADLLHA